MGALDEDVPPEQLREFALFGRNIDAPSTAAYISANLDLFLFDVFPFAQGS
jgi:hypothetical protein